MRFILLLGFFFEIATANMGTVKDISLSTLYLGKASVPFWILPAAVEDGDMLLWTDLGLFTVLTAPAAGVLYHRWIGNPEKVVLWRKINRVTDLSLALGGAAFGVARMFTPDPQGGERIIGNKTGGVLILLMSAMYGSISLLEKIPFSVEAERSARISVQPLFSFQTKQTGLSVQYRY